MSKFEVKNSSKKYIELDVQGMTCASCARRIEKKLNKLDGVVASVNYATERASVHYDTPIETADLVSTVEAAGYSATVPSLETAQEHSAIDPSASLKQRVVVSTTLGIPVLLLAMIPALQFTNWQWASLTLAAPIVVWGGWPFHKAAFINLKHRATTMDTLVSVGTLAAFGWSLWALFFGDAGHPGMKMEWSLALERGRGINDIYLEVAAVVIVFLLAGRYFEASAKRKSGEAIKELGKLGAKDVSVLDDDNSERRIPIEQLTPGMKFVTRPGEKIATDGKIVSGTSALDNSLITGESVPVDVGPGDKVIGATINTYGRLVVEATRVGSETTLATMSKLVEAAQSGKAPVQRLADRISAVFVPVVILLAASTLAFWLIRGESAAFAFSAAVAVLIIACPCALGLATPTALLVGTGRGAQLGILINGPEVLEDTRRVNTILLDKTGTVTTGEMNVVDVVTAENVSRKELLEIASAIESSSEHPIARAIVRASPTSITETTDFKNHEGFGVSAVVNEREVIVGKLTLLENFSFHIDTSLRDAITQHQARGYTSVAVGWDKNAYGVIAIADSPKPESKEAIDALKRIGLHPILLTGDHEQAAKRVADEVGIDEVFADVLPAGKLEVVHKLQSQGQTVAMTGDGVNDAAALAAADLGIAMGTGTDVAIAASDLTVMGGNLRNAATAISLSRRTLKTIKMNLVWAFGYNVAAIPLAAAGLLNPLVAGAAMALSSIFVVTNSLRLRRFHDQRRSTNTRQSPTPLMG